MPTISRSIFFAIFFLFLLNTVSAQKDSRHISAKLISSVPFKTFSGGIIIVKIRMGNLPDSLNFLIDTGSSGVSLDSATSHHFELIPIASDQILVGIGGSRNAMIVKNQTIHFGDFSTDSINLNVTDYSILSSVYGEKIDGILGNNFLSRYIVTINYDSSKLYFYSKGNLHYPKGGFLLKTAIVGLPMQVTQVKDASEVSSRFYFDTGAGLCMLLSEDFVNDSSLLNPRKKTLRTQAEGMGGKVDMRITYLKEVRIGSYRFHKVPTYIFNDENNTMAYPNLGGLIGNDLLRRFNVTLNYDQKEFYLVPNSHLRDPFDYSYTGLHIYWTDGAIIVADVMKNSPAEKAGLKPDDIIMAIDNNFTGNMQAYTAILQNVGARINFIIKRKEGLKQLTLVVKSIF